MLFNTFSLLVLPFLTPGGNALVLPKEQALATHNASMTSNGTIGIQVLAAAAKSSKSISRKITTSTSSKIHKTKTRTKSSVTEAFATKPVSVNEPKKTKTETKKTTSVSVTQSFATKPISVSNAAKQTGAASSLSCPGSNGAHFKAGSSVFQVQCYLDHYGGDSGSAPAASFSDCINLCASTTGCVDVSYTQGTCWMKSSLQPVQQNPGVWGAKLIKQAKAPVSTTSSTSSTRLTTTATKTTSTKSSTTTVPKSTTTKATKTKTKPQKTTSSTTTTYADPFQTVIIQKKMTTTQNKRGLAYNDPTLTYLFGGEDSQVSWMYDWGQDLCAGGNQDFECLPMLWSDADALTSTWNSTVQTAISRGLTRVLGFNEPDYVDQANMTPKAAAKAWIEYMQPYASQLELGGPAVTGQPSGLVWLQEFYGNLTKMDATAMPDFQPVHWYDQAWNTGWLKIFLQEAYSIASVPVWLTEFEGFGTDAQQATFLQTVTPWMDSQTWIGGYAYFGVFNGMMVNFNGTGNNTSGWPLQSLVGEAFDAYYNKTVPASMQ